MSLKQQTSLASMRNTSPNGIVAKFFSEECSRTLETAERLGEALVRLSGEVKITTTNYMVKGLYGRRISIPRGAFLIGKIQKAPNISIQLNGHMTIWRSDIGVSDTFGPDITEIDAGVRRVGFAHTDVDWVCVYQADATKDMEQDALSDILTYRNYEEYANTLIKAQKDTIWLGQ